MQKRRTEKARPMSTPVRKAIGGRRLFLLADITFSLINQTGFLLKTRSVTRRRK